MTSLKAVFVDHVGFHVSIDFVVETTRFAIIPLYGTFIIEVDENSFVHTKHMVNEALFTLLFTQVTLLDFRMLGIHMI